MGTFEVTIPLRYLPNVKARVTAVNRKMAKRDAPPFVLEEGWRGVKRIAPRNDRDPIDIPAVTLRITGQPFKIPGYSLAGVFYRGEDGEPNRLVSFGGHQFSSEQQNCGERCDHCKTERQRKVLFLLKEMLTGDIKQIGGDCSEIYLGVSPARAVNTIGLFDEALSVLKMMEEEYWGDEISELDGNRGASLPLLDYLGGVATAIRLSGWYSVSRAEELGVEPTASEAFSRAIGNSPFPPETPAKDMEMAEQALAHWRSRFPVEEPQVLGEFEANIKLIVHSSQISKKSFGRAAWLIQGYQKELDQALRSEQAAMSVYQGQEGEPIETVLRVNRRSVFETQFGPSYIYSMSDANGNAYAWKTASTPEGMDIGTITAVRAKVKRHSEYRGVKQTELSHVKAEFSFPEFPASPEEWVDARTQGFLVNLAAGWFNKALAKGVDVPSAINGSMPSVLGLLVDRWLTHSGAYADGAAHAIKEAIKAGADPSCLAEYRFLGEYSLSDVLQNHPEVAGMVEAVKKPRRRPSASLSM